MVGFDRSGLVKLKEGVMAKIGFGLDAGDLFPDMRVRLTSGEVIDVPGWFKGAYGVFLVYRGHW